MRKLYKSNRDESVPLFRNPVLDKLTYVHPATPHIVFVPVVVFLLWMGGRSSLGWSSMIGCFFLGLCLWSLAEYLLHRFVFHFRPRTGWQEWLAFLIHGVHHDYPRDSRRLVMPPAASVPLAVPFYFLFRLFGGVYYAPLFAGFITGYLAYDTLHYAMHHFSLRGRLARAIKQHHMSHHYLDPERNFGVTSPLWDHLFGTHLPRGSCRASPAQIQGGRGN